LNLQGVAERIKALRESLGLNQTELATQLNVHQTKISQTEAGKMKPSFEVLFFLSENCSVTIDYILKGENSFQPGKATQMNMSMQTEAAKEAMASLNKCAKSIKKLDMSVVLGIKYYENELKKVPRDPEIKKTLEGIKSEEEEAESEEPQNKEYAQAS